MDCSSRCLMGSTGGPPFLPSCLFISAGNGPCLGFRKPNQPYQWLSYQEVSDKGKIPSCPLMGSWYEGVGSLGGTLLGLGTFYSPGMLGQSPSLWLRPVGALSIYRQATKAVSLIYRSPG